MQVLQECRDSRDDHMQTRARQRVRLNRDDLFVGETGPGNDVEEIDMSKVLDHLTEIDRMSSNKTEVFSRETQMCIGEFKKAGWYESAGGVSSTRGGGSAVELNLEEAPDLEDEWRSTYETRKLAWKQETKNTGDDMDTSCETGIAQLKNFEMVEETINVGRIENVEEPGESNGSPTNVMGQLVEKWMLNVKQRRAFNIVASHSTGEKGAQLLMYLGGPGGMGKSRVVSALRDFFGQRGESRCFRLAAYTGVAVRNIGGATLHSLLQMNESGRRHSAKVKGELADMWDGVDYLFIDEVSMIRCEMLHNISSILTEAKGKTSAFGGVNMVLAGDFAQLPPIGDVRLYKKMDISGLALGALKHAQAKVLGKLLWLSIETVVILHEVVRQGGSENKRFVELLQRLHTGICMREDYVLLKGRVMQEVGLMMDNEWCAAPVIITNNATRDAINVRATQAFAERTGSNVHWYDALDMHKRSKINDRALIENLEKQHSGQTKHRLRRILFVIGMPVLINQNFDVKAGVVNGSWGIYMGRIQ